MIKELTERSARDSKWLSVSPHSNGFYKTLLAMTGHDLRHPLQVIVSVNALLSRRLSGVSECEYLARSREASFQLIKQLDRLVEALRVHERAENVSLQPVFLEFLLDELRREHAPAAQAAGLTLRVVPSHSVVMSNAFLLEGMLRNLLYNAIKYTPPGGKILVGCHKLQSGFRIEVHDTGIGMPPEHISKIFQAFTRLDATASEGLGLGLFIVRHAAESLGHTIDVRSKVGRGSCFGVTISSEAKPS